MKPFLELPIVVMNNENKNKEVIARIQPTDISYYYPGFYDGTIVVMKSASSYMTSFTVDQLDAALIAYEKSTKDKPGVFGNLKLTSKPKLHVTD